MDTAHDYPGTGYELVCIFDALHDMGDPVGAARHILESPDGTWLLVEPMAGETLEDSKNPVGRIFYSASPLVCTPSAQAQEGGYALGNQVPDSVWREILSDAGFTRFRRAAETPFNRIFELRHKPLNRVHPVRRITGIAPSMATALGPGDILPIPAATTSGRRWLS